MYNHHHAIYISDLVPLWLKTRLIGILLAHSLSPSLALTLPICLFSHIVLAENTFALSSKPARVDLMREFDSRESAARARTWLSGWVLFAGWDAAGSTSIQGKAERGRKRTVLLQSGEYI